MKRTLMILSLLGLLFSTAGCVLGNYDGCPPEKGLYNVSLEFSLPDDKGNDVFGSHISTVELGIYNEQGALIMLKHLSQTELAGFKGVKLTLDPGLYHVVGWGNVGDNTLYKGVDAPHPFGAHVTYNGANSGKVANADKVYYAPGSGGLASEMPDTYRMVVDPVTGHTGVLEFTPAHRTVRVYIEGYDGMPEVELLNVPEGLLWFGMDRLDGIAEFQPALIAAQSTRLEEKDGIRYDYTAFDTFHFDADNNIALNIVDHSTHGVVFDITLNEALEKTGFPTGTVITIVLKFAPAGVEVTIPKWEGQDADPGFEV